MGRGKHAHDIRGKRHWLEPRLSAVELEQPSRHLVGYAAVQGIAPRGLVEKGRGNWWRVGHLFRRGAAIGSDYVAGRAWQSNPRNRRGGWRGAHVRVDVHPLPEGIHHRHESAHLSDVLYLWRDD